MTVKQNKQKTNFIRTSPPIILPNFPLPNQPKKDKNENKLSKLFVLKLIPLGCQGDSICKLAALAITITPLEDQKKTT